MVVVLVAFVEFFAVVEFDIFVSSSVIQFGVKHPTLNKTITTHAMQAKHPKTASDMIF